MRRFLENAAAFLGWLREGCPDGECSFPCGLFKNNGSFGCLNCEWNLAAHSEADQRRELGDDFYEEVQQDLAQHEEAD